MKKIIIVLLLVSIATIGVSAEVVRQQSGNGVTVDWSFAPEVSTHVGVNLDQLFFGMEGEAKLTAKTVIRKSATEEFTGDEAAAGVYAKIEVKDLEIKFDTEDQNQGRADRKQNADGSYEDGGTPYSYGDGSNDVSGAPLLIKWGDINGTLFMGPAYLELKAKEHDKIDHLEGMDEDISVVEYDIIPAGYTGRYKEKTALESTPGFEDSSVAPTLTAASDNLAAAAVGFKMDNLLDLKLGLSTAYSYKDRLIYDYNPMALSVNFELLAVENLTLKTRLAFITGQNNMDVLNPNNPMSLALTVGYNVAVGDNFSVKPVYLIDLKLERKEEDGDEFIYPFETALGVHFLWDKLGVSSEEKDYFEGGDHDVTDGVSLSATYGSQPHNLSRDINLQYIGAKIALWESEGGADKPGIVPGLEGIFVTNINYAFGGEFDDVSFNGATTNVELEPQLDVGLGLDLAYTVSFVKPKLGLLFKAFNVLDSDKIGTIGGIDQDINNANEQDLRVKVGLDVIKLVPNTTFEALWESGDLIQDDYSKDNYSSDNAFFDNEAGSGRSSGRRNFVSGAQFGYIKLGVKLAF